MLDKGETVTFSPAERAQFIADIERGYELAAQRVRRMTDADRYVVRAYAMAESQRMTVGPPFDEAEAQWEALCAMEPELRLRAIQRLLNSADLLRRMRHPFELPVS